MKKTHPWRHPWKHPSWAENSSLDVLGSGEGRVCPYCMQRVPEQFEHWGCIEDRSGADYVERKVSQA